MATEPAELLERPVNGMAQVDRVLGLVKGTEGRSDDQGRVTASGNIRGSDSPCRFTE